MNNASIDNLTIQECATVANLVYNKGTSPTGGWTQYGPERGKKQTAFNTADMCQGFYGAAYVLGEDMVVAYRGTANWTDALQDACMVPVKTKEQAREFGRKFMIRYTRNGNWPADAFADAFEAIFELKATQSALGEYANRIPPDHAQQAITVANLAQQYAQKNKSGIKYQLRCFVGHSLGGALAQYASEQSGGGGLIDGKAAIPGVSFNGPCMGNIAGMRRGFGGGIVAVHNELDPLSLAMNLAGNQSHAGREGVNEFALKVEMYSVPPPNPPTWPKYCSALVKAVALKPLLGWLGSAAGYYHDMDRVYMGLLSNSPVGSKSLNSIYPYQGAGR